MFCRPARFYGLLVLLAVAAGSCGRRVALGPRPLRFAILRFENLGADPAQDWIGRALAEVVLTDLSRARDVTVVRVARMHAIEGFLGLRPLSAPGISTERQAALAAGAGRLGYGTYRIAGGRLRVDFTIEDVKTRKTQRVVSVSGAAGDVIAVGGAMAGKISSQATAFPTHSVAALRGYAEAMELSDMGQAVPRLEEAMAADPNYGPAYRALAQLELQHQDRSGSEATLTRALERGAALAAPERALIAADLAGLQNQPQLRLRALAALVKLDPNDDGAWQALGALALNRRQYAQAERAYRNLLEREPEDFNSWNQFGYAAAYAGDLDTARDAMRHYAGLRPTDVNPLDSMGDVNLLCGRYHEAELSYLMAAAKDPNFHNNGDFFKAAMARLWTGDIAGADALAARYHQARAAAHDPLVGFRQIQWKWITGRRKQACREMETYARGALNDVAPRAWTELTVWEMMLGDRVAAQSAAEATARTGGANSGGAAVTHFMVEPEASGAEWAARAGRDFPNPQQGAIRNVALMAALLFGGQFEAASAALQQTMDAGPPEPDATAPVLLAWTYLETGKAVAAATFLKTTPAPSLNGADALLSFSFPRLYYLRGEEAAREGKRDEARADYRLFLTLSGPDPLRWGEEEKARAALAGS